MSYGSIAWHRSMALDRVRNDAYAEALKQVVHANSVVLDLGAGSGVLGLIAARLGARRVYLVEPEDIIAVAEEIVHANGLDETVRCIRGRIEDVQLPEKVDVIVSVLTGNFLLTEDLLPTLFHARDHALKPGGVLVPSAAAMEVVPVCAADVHRREIAGWSSARHGVDLGAARAYAANTVLYRSEGMRDAEYLADPVTLHDIDFSAATEASVHSEVSFVITRAGECHGCLGWFRMKLGDRWLSTSPRDEAVHWTPVLLPIDPPLQLEAGARVTLQVDRPPRGEWAWRLHHGRDERRHSTFLSMPMTPETLRKASLAYQPSLTPAGQALAHVLEQCTGRLTVDAIAQSLCSRYPAQYRSASEAVRFVQKIIKQYG